MLFNSYTFIFLFLPLTMLGYWLLGRWSSRRLVIGWLLTCSVAFYGLWNPVSLAIILPSVLGNYLLARGIQALAQEEPEQNRRADALLVAGIAFNLCILGYFKYRNFFVDSVNQLAGTQWPIEALLLPLGISFITFQKIAFLVDVRFRTVQRFDAMDFLIFVFFFPQLIAGPIVHYREMMPQFGTMPLRPRSSELATGLGLFAIGLFKKAVLADGIAPHASSAFAAAERGEPLSMAVAWMGAFAYTLQIYFDFSGYSDMAIGLARMFGIRLPANFNSPLKSTSIIEFWSRWHITLTRFLTAYTYTPTVMHFTRVRMQKGQPVLGRKHRSAGAFLALVAGPTLFTMFLSGLWHGAGLTFIAWGLLHGVYLAINHAWRLWRPQWDKVRYELVMCPLGFFLTFTAVVVGMVLFRANSFSGAGHMLQSMAGFDGLSLPAGLLAQLGALGEWLTSHGVLADPMSGGRQFLHALAWIAALLAIALAAPNSLDLMRSFEPALHFQAAPAPQRFAAALTLPWALLLGSLLLAGMVSLNRISEFLYWQF
jgi:alginate O-acetyltransferase complex protein AlgI